MPLKLYKRGNVWWMSGSIRGISVRKSTKTTDKKVADTVRIVLERELLDESIFGKRHTMTFDQAADAYLASGGSSRFLESVRAALGKTELRKINQSTLDETARKIYPTAAPATVNRQLYTPFIAVWNYAALSDWVISKKWRRPSERRSTVTVAGTRRVGTFPVEYDHACKFVSELAAPVAMIFTALFYTGMRPIELFSMRRQDVDVAKRWVILWSSKSGEPRGVPMHDFLAPLFESLLARNDRKPEVFRTFKGEPYRAGDDYGGQLKTAISTARRRSGIKGIAPYTGRHSCSTGLVVAGVHPHIKDQILGHASDSMSRRYTNVPQTPLIDAINTLPVPAAWREFWWWDDPLEASRRQSSRGARARA